MDPQIRGRIMTNLGLLYGELGRLEEGAAHMERALELMDSVDNHRADSLARSLLADAYRQLGRYDEAIRWAQNALTVSRKERHQYHEAAALSTLGQILADSGDPDRARSCLARAYVLAERLGVPETAQTAASIAELETASGGLRAPVATGSSGGARQRLVVPSQGGAQAAELGGRTAQSELVLLGGGEISMQRVVRVDPDSAVNVDGGVRHPVPGVRGPEFGGRDLGIARQASR